MDEQQVIIFAMRHGQDHLIEGEDDLGDEEEASRSEDEDDGRVPVLVLASVVGWLVPIEDDEEVEDSEIEEELVIEIATMDPAPAYTE